MRPPLTAPRPFLICETTKARAAIAASLYAPDRVYELATAAALAGFASVRISQTTGVDLRETPAAAALIAWARDKKLSIEWEPRNLALPDGREAKVLEPVLGWQE